MEAHVISLVFALSGWWVAGLVFGLALAECSLFIGFIFPAEIAVILGGVLWSRGTVHLWQAIPAAVLGATIGDSIGYALGERFGGAFLMRKFGKRWMAVQDALNRHGAAAVFFGRFSAFLRAAIPSAAGAACIPYRRFVLWNVIGGVTWGTGFTLLGYVSAESYHAVIDYAGDAGWTLLGVITAMVLVAMAWRRRARRRAEAAAKSQSD